MTCTTNGRYFDFTEGVEPSQVGDGLTAAETIIIEGNTGTQTNYPENYTAISWNPDGTPALIEKYEDDTMFRKLWTITPTFTDGLPTQVVTVNEDDNITTTTTITWVNNLPTEITKV